MKTKRIRNRSIRAEKGHPGSSFPSHSINCINGSRECAGGGDAEDKGRMKLSVSLSLSHRKWEEKKTTAGRNWIQGWIWDWQKKKKKKKQKLRTEKQHFVKTVYGVKGNSRMLHFSRLVIAKERGIIGGERRRQTGDMDWKKLENCRVHSEIGSEFDIRVGTRFWNILTSDVGNYFEFQTLQVTRIYQCFLKSVLYSIYNNQIFYDGNALY